MKAVAADEHGRVLARASAPLPRRAPPPEAARLVAALGRRLAAGLPGRPRAAGVGVPGFVHSDGHLLRSPNLPGWRDLDLPRLFGRALGLPVVVGNDLNMAAVGEVVRGAARGFSDVLVAALGTGLGGALVLDGRVRAGPHGTAGEIGHMPLAGAEPPDLPCPCGGRGCAERYVGRDAVVRRARRAGRPVRSPADLAALARRGDRAARRVWAEVGRDLGRHLAACAHVLDVEAVVVGGGIAAAGRPLWGPMRAAFRAGLLAPLRGRVEILPARLGPEAGAVGAALAARGLSAVSRRGSPARRPRRPTRSRRRPSARTGRGRRRRA